MNTPREYVEARRVLLDALQALGDHLSSFILVGAQAVYLFGSAAGGRLRAESDVDLAV